MNAPKNIKVYILNFFGILLLFLLAAFAMVTIYIPSLPGPVGRDIVEKRKVTLAEVNAAQQEKISTYAWINKEEGTVQIPVERSMGLIVDELKSKKSNSNG